MADEVAALQCDGNSAGLDFTWPVEPQLSDDALEIWLEEELVPSLAALALTFSLRIVVLGLLIEGEVGEVVHSCFNIAFIVIIQIGFSMLVISINAIKSKNITHIDNPSLHHS